MKKSALIFALILIFCMPGIHAADAKTEFFVSTAGSDLNAGTKNAPFKTLERAQSEVRKYNKNMSADITVNVEKGTYFQQNPFELTAEDSGTNGFKVIYRGDSMQTVLSGGKRVEGFVQHEGDVYKAVLPEEYGDKRISGLYVNGKPAQRAYSRQLYKATSFSETNAKEKTALLLMKSEPELSLKTPQEAQLQYAHTWQTHLFPILGVSEDITGSTCLTLPYYAYEAMGTNDVCYAFKIWNDYSLMSEPNDFFYNSAERTVYYKKPDSVDINAAEIIAPYLEKVFAVQGENAANKAHDISVEGFSFSHTDDFTANSSGYKNCQSTQSYYYEPKPVYPSSGLLNEAGVWVNNAQNVEIINNKFCNSQRVGLGIYEGVTDSLVEGNIFTDLGCSALNIGLPSHRYVRDGEYGLTNVSFRKNAVTDKADDELNAAKACDEHFESFAEVGAGAYWQVDLGKSYTVSRLEIDPWPGMVMQNFDILVSDQENFLEYKTAVSLDKNDYTSGEVWEKDIQNSKIKGRYVRFVNKTGSLFRLNDLRVFTADLGKMPATEVCSNIKVSNNVIKDVATFLNAAAGIQSYYIADINIEHNEIYNCPYSGIAIGWGWARSLDKTMKNNKVNQNLIVGTMQHGFDGGGIYSLGAQSNEEIAGNYIKDARQSFGGVYPDNGSSDIYIHGNVVENSPVGYMPYSRDQKDIRVEDNYATTQNSTLGAINSYIKNTQIFVKGYMPDEVKQIADKAGLEPEFEFVRQLAGADRNTTQFARNYPTAEDMYMRAYNYGPDKGVHEAWLTEAKTVLEIAVKSNMITKDNMNAFAKLSNAIKTAENYDDYDGKTAEQITQESYTLTAALRKTVDEFLDSGVFTSSNYKMLRQDMDTRTGAVTDAASVPVYDGKVFNTDTVFDDFTHMTDYKTNLKQVSDSEICFSGGESTYTAYTFGDTEFDMKLKTAGINSYPGFVMRASADRYLLSVADCYLVTFKPEFAELQRFNKGKQTFLIPKIPLAGYKHGVANTVRASISNEAGGVRIKIEAGGEELCNYLDSDSEAVYNPGFFAMLAPTEISLLRNGANTDLFNDLAGFEWAADSVNKLKIYGVFSGESFNPGGSITAGELALMLETVAGGESTDAYAAFEKLRITDGATGFDTVLTRGAAADIVGSYLISNGIFADGSGDGEVLAGADLCRALKIMSAGADGDFYGGSTLQRAEAAVIVMRISEYL